MQEKSGIAQLLETSMLHEWDDHVLQELGIEQVSQILRGSVVVQTYGLKNKRIIFMFL